MVQGVESVIGQQADLVLLAVAAHVDQAGQGCPLVPKTSLLVSGPYPPRRIDLARPPHDVLPDALRRDAPALGGLFYSRHDQRQRRLVQEGGHVG